MGNGKPTFFHKHGGGVKITKNNKRAIRVWATLRLSRSSSFSLLKFVGAKIARVLGLASTRKSKTPCKVSSSLERSGSYANYQIDSHRAEAIEDCIEFLNNSSLQRLNSISSTSCC